MSVENKNRKYIIFVMGVYISRCSKKTKIRNSPPCKLFRHPQNTTFTPYDHIKLHAE